MEEDYYIANRKHHYKNNRIKTLSVNWSKQQYVFRIRRLGIIQNSLTPDSTSEKKVEKITIRRTFAFSKITKESDFKKMIDEWKRTLYENGIIFPPLTTVDEFVKLNFYFQNPVITKYAKDKREKEGKELDEVN